MGLHFSIFPFHGTAPPDFLLKDAPSSLYRAFVPSTIFFGASAGFAGPLPLRTSGSILFLFSWRFFFLLFFDFHLLPLQSSMFSAYVLTCMPGFPIIPVGLVFPWRLYLGTHGHSFLGYTSLGVLTFSGLLPVTPMLLPPSHTLISLAKPGALARPFQSVSPLPPLFPCNFVWFLLTCSFFCALLPARAALCLHVFAEPNLPERIPQRFFGDPSLTAAQT